MAGKWMRDWIVILKMAEGKQHGYMPLTYYWIKDIL
jgi:hypothetical protein